MLLRLPARDLLGCPPGRGLKKGQQQNNKQNYKSHMKLFKYTMLVAALCTAFTMQSAKADFLSTLTFSNLPPGNPGPYGTVDVSLTGQTATITFTAAAGYFFGDGSSAAVELNTGSFTEAFVSESPSDNFKAFAFDQQVDGFGNFDLALDQNNFKVKLTSITFTVTNTDALHPWATDADVLALNADGFDAAAHVFSTSSGLTGFAAEAPGGRVPDGGATAALLGLALAGLGGLRARFGRN
jgi:VPDSG-CTERM motif